jgi:hypothetical protein
MLVDRSTYLTRDAFEHNYIRWHGTLPVMAAVPSSALGEIVPAASCRLVHVDGAHDHQTVAADARISRVISVPGADALRGRLVEWAASQVPSRRTSSGRSRRAANRAATGPRRVAMRLLRKGGANAGC